MPKLRINRAEQAIDQLVVIAGIAIAFALNNWNEKRKAFVRPGNKCNPL